MKVNNTAGDQIQFRLEIDALGLAKEILVAYSTRLIPATLRKRKELARKAYKQALVMIKQEQQIILENIEEGLE